jgi:hypothetical protein
MDLVVRSSSAVPRIDRINEILGMTIGLDLHFFSRISRVRSTWMHLVMLSVSICHYQLVKDIPCFNSLLSVRCLLRRFRGRQGSPDIQPRVNLPPCGSNTGSPTLMNVQSLNSASTHSQSTLKIATYITESALASTISIFFALNQFSL